MRPGPVIIDSPFRYRTNVQKRVAPQRFRVPALHVRYVVPRDAVICARRKIRKEVIFAKGKAGRGGQRRPRRNDYSNVVCV